MGPHARGGARSVAESAHGRAGRPSGALEADGSGNGVHGMVEQFSKRLIVGWVSVPAGSPPTKVTLHLGPLQVAATYATPGAAMSGFNSSLRGKAPKGAAAEARRRAESMDHPWQLPNIPGPADDQRNSKQEVRTFSFRVRGIWPYAKKRTQVRVKVDDRPLPIYGHGMFLSPPSNGKRSVKKLREKFEAGYLFSQTGKLQLSKKLDEDWQRRVMEMYQLVRRVVAEECGYDVFFVYGTLLGAVREGGYIGHDIDFDAAYVSKHSRPADAAHELAELGLRLIERGLDVRCMATALHIHDPSDPSARIDLFHTFFNEEGLLSFPFGVAGTSAVRREEWQGTREIDFPGGRGLVPTNAEDVVRLLYGEDWRRPKPGFNWNLDRTDSAGAGLVSSAEREKVYWANFYARMEYTEGSTFFEFVNAQSDIPAQVIDIGCGDGRDSCAFGAAGRQVVGLDRSDVGIEHAAKHAEASNLADKVSFEVCDVSDAEALKTAVLEPHPGW